MDSLQRYVPLGYAQISSLDSAKGLGTIPAGATVAVIIPQAQAVRFRDDGTAPTGISGMPIAVGQEFVYSGSLSAFAVIEQAASAVLNVAFYRGVG
ncbi:MAG TPA: hypothetical protein VIU44_08095 [Gaiellaceae bacterium]